MKDPQRAQQLIAQCTALLDELETTAASKGTAAPTPAGKGANRRVHRRLRYRKPLGVDIEHPGGGLSRIGVFARNLSESGIAFLHTGYVHKGSKVIVHMTKLKGSVQAAPGAIVNCRHIRGPWHEVCVKFNENVLPHHFIDTGAAGVTEGGEAVELPCMRGHVLYVEDSAMDHKLFSHLLSKSRMKLEIVTTGEEAITLAAQKLFDIVVTDLNLPGKFDGLGVVAELRKGGFAGPIVLMTADNRGDRLAAAKSAGATHQLLKPYTPKALWQLMGELHRQTGAIMASEALHSTMEDQPEMAGVLADYVKYLHDVGDKLEAAIKEGGEAAARELCLGIKGSAAGYGFEPIGEAASETIKSLDATMSVAESRAKLRSLSLMCRSTAFSEGTVAKAA